ncbi:9149_t:CDS:2 [Scutellospora calospora]|uniref:9149_t:CDS:1 n=1 Tax=Scutellospora calospora TaxID=85575 RepID=A0ACA9JUF6_9GLOM|nr:9149_t:CDS:2 [Scutellospora calospora]
MNKELKEEKLCPPETEEKVPKNEAEPSGLKGKTWKSEELKDTQTEFKLMPKEIEPMPPERKLSPKKEADEVKACGSRPGKTKELTQDKRRIMAM